MATIATQEQLDALAAVIAAKINQDRGRIGDLASLTTTVKTSLVLAVNEVAAQISGFATTAEVSAAVSNAISALTTGAPAALNTLDELAAAIGDDANFAATLTAALGNRVRFDAAQILTDPQKTQALGNLGVTISTLDVAAAFAAAVTP